MENRNRRWVRLGTHRKTKQNRMEEINVNKEERVEGEKTWASSGAEELVVTTTFPALPNSEVRERKSTVHGWPFSKERNTYGTHDVTGSSFPFLKIVIYIFFLLLLFLYASLYAIAALQTRQRSSLSIRPWRTAKGRREDGDDVSKQKKRSRPSCPHFQVERDLCCIARYPLCLGNVLLRSRTILQNDLRNRRDNRQ